MKWFVEMNGFIPRVFINVISFAYEGIFHEKMSEDVKNFFKDLSYVGLGTIIATIFSFTFNILGGRILEPSGYGKFALVQSIAMFLYIPMLLGLATALVKYNAEKEDYNRQRSIISTTYMLVFIFTIISIFIYHLFSSQISEIFLISKEIFYLAVFFAVLFVFHALTTNTIGSLHKMRMLSVLQPIHNAVLLAFFLVFILLNFVSFKSMVFSVYLAYGIIGGVILMSLHKYLIFEFNKPWAKILTRYSRFAVLGGISFMLYTNIDKILINKYMLLGDVGLYNAYYYASINVISLFSGIFITVFFPTVSKYKDKTPIFKRVNKFIPFLIVFGLPFILLSEYLILKLFGEKYPINILLMLLFAITSLLVAWYGIYAWLFNSEGEKGVKITLSGTGTIAITNIILNIYLIPRIGLYGAIGSTAIAYCIGMCVIYARRGNILQHRINNDMDGFKNE